MPKDVAESLGVRAEHHVTRSVTVTKEMRPEDRYFDSRPLCEIPHAMSKHTRIFEMPERHPSAQENESGGRRAGPGVANVVGKTARDLREQWQPDGGLGFRPDDPQASAMPVDVRELQLQHLGAAESATAHQQKLSAIASSDGRGRINCVQDLLDDRPRQGPRRLIMRSAHRRNDRGREIMRNPARREEKTEPASNSRSRASHRGGATTFGPLQQESIDVGDRHPPPIPVVASQVRKKSNQVSLIALQSALGRTSLFTGMDEIRLDDRWRADFGWNGLPFGDRNTAR